VYGDSIMDALDKARAKTRKAKEKKLLAMAKLYEESLEPKIVLLFRRMEEMIAHSQMPLTHINLVLDMLKAKCVEMSITAYVDKGADKLPTPKDK